MGHVPPGPIFGSCPGPDLPGRQRRGARELGAAHLTDSRQALGKAGERLAAWFLTEHGLAVQRLNLELDEGELDLLARDGRDLVIVEVRTTTSLQDPIDAIGDSKRRRVRNLAAGIGVRRVDFLGIGLGKDAIDFHWVRS